MIGFYCKGLGNEYYVKCWTIGGLKFVQCFLCVNTWTKGYKRNYPDISENRKIQFPQQKTYKVCIACESIHMYYYI